MARGYTPGLQVVAGKTIRRIRELPLEGKHEVTVGKQVKANDTVLSASLPGEVEIIRVADRLGLEPLDIEGKVLVKSGDKVKQGELVCEVVSFFGMFTSELQSPLEGTVEFFTKANGHLGIRRPPVPLSINAYISGKIVDIEEGRKVTIETTCTFIQGIFGVGGESQGVVNVLDVERDQEVKIGDLEKHGNLEGKILVGGSSYSLEALKLAGKMNAKGIVTGSIDAETLREYVGFEIGVSITGDEEVPATLIITEGFGDLPISERVVQLAKKSEGLPASLNGATQVRAGAMRPELIIPGDHSSAHYDFSPAATGELKESSRIRIIRVPWFGQIATVEELPSAPEEIESGAVVRVLRARLDQSGELVTVPRANVELI